MTSLAIGDVVRLKSGGPLMTVTALHTDYPESSPDTTEDRIKCQWFDENRTSKMLRFPVAALQVEATSSS